MEIRRSYDRLISTMGFPILVRWHIYIESGPWIDIGQYWPRYSTILRHEATTILHGDICLGNTYTYYVTYITGTCLMYEILEMRRHWPTQASTKSITLILEKVQHKDPDIQQPWCSYSFPRIYWFLHEKYCHGRLMHKSMNMRRNKSQ